MRVILFGTTGTIGQAVARALVRQGHDAICVARTGTPSPSWRLADVTDPASLTRDAFRGERFDAVMSCLASRTGTPKDAWAIDHDAHKNILAASKSAGHFVLLSALCVQKPHLAFQHAKLAFERALIEWGLAYSIVRPTAFFKSLSGQLDRLRQGKPYLLFGDGTLTACKPISDDDLASYLVACLTDQTRHNKILPIGGPGPAITPKQQGERLFALLGREPRFRRVPVSLLDVIIGTLATLGHALPAMAAKAELARIGRYYATESMLVYDPAKARYDADATPSTGTETLFDFYAHLVDQNRSVNRGDHTVF